MKTIHFRKLCPILLLTLLLPAIGQVAYSATVAWTNTLGGNWNVAANWNPNQIPGPGDTANITNAGTYTVTLNVNASVLNLAIGGASSGVQTLEGNGFTLAVTNGIVSSSGVLALTNSSLSGGLAIGGGGLFNESGETINGQLTVQSGGEFLANSSTTLGGNANSTNEWVWVQSGGLMNAASGAPITLYVQMTNAGTLNFTNYGIYSLYNPGGPNYDGGLVNQAGGIMNLIGGASISGGGGFDYVLNQGTINVTNGNSTIGVDNMFNQGTVATLPGTETLTIGNFNGPGTLAGTYNAAAGTTIKLVSNNNPGTSPGAGLALGGSGQYEFTSGLLTLPSNVIPNLVLDGGMLSLGPAFQGGAITNLTLNGINMTNTLPITGALVTTNGTLYGAIIVANNGLLLTGSSTTVDAQVTVENGGELLAIGSTTFGGNANSTNEWVWVQSGGLMNAGSVAPITLYVQMTNAGTLNFTNYGIYSLYNPGSPSYDGGLVNQAGGIMNLIGGASISGGGGFDYVLNQGTINVTNGNSTISVDNMFNQGTVATLPGTETLTIGSFNGPGTLAGTYNAAAGTTIKLVSNNNPGTSPGAGLALGGSGQYEFTSGLLTLTNNTIPNLALVGGSLSLGPAFQGGAITNLTLNGINVTNTLPITGALMMTNGTLYGSFIVADNGLLLTGGSTTVQAQVTVENGGELLATGSTTFGGNPSSTNEWVWVQSGGLMNAGSVAPITLYVQMTNAGTLNFTNYGIYSLYNPGSPNYDGGLVNQAGGIMNFIGGAGISGGGGFDYVLNQGTINVTNGNSTISVDNMLNQGTVATLPGTETLTIGNFNGPGTLAGTYNAAAGTTIKLVSNNNPGTSPGAGLALGGSGQYEFTSGLLTLTNNTIPNLALVGGSLSLGPAFQGGAITNLTLNGINVTNTLPITGALVMTNGTLYGSFIVADNGLLLTGGSTTVQAQVTVENGGELLATGSTTFGGNPSSTNEWVWVQSGGLMDTASGAPITLYVQMTNAGTLNFTNYGIYSLYNSGSPNYDGGLVNQAGGIMNLIGGAGIAGGGGFDYVLNQGTINVTNGNSTIGVDNMFNQGTVATLPGTETLTIGNFNGPDTLAGTYNTAAGTTIKFVSNNNPGTSPGAGLALGGSGQYEFTSGLLTLTNNTIPNLALVGGSLSLGPAFQGGAITNLTLNGINMTNTLPITGALMMTNGTLYGSFVIADNGVLLTGGSTTVQAQVTVENGGELLAIGSTTFGGNPNSTNEWVWVQSGGLMDAGSVAPITLYVQMTNAGTLNFTNYGIYSLYNPGSPSYDGGLVNQAGGIMNFIGGAGISGGGGFDYVLNQGTINVTNGNSTISVDNLTNSGTLNTELWTLQLPGANLDLQSSGSLHLSLAGPTTFGKFNMAKNAALTGSLVVNLSNGYFPTVGSSFAALSYPSFSGGFTGFSSPPGADVAWQPVYSTNALTLVVQPLIALLPSETNVVVSLNGTPGHQAIELASTNVTVPLSNWTPLNTNTVDVTTYLSVTNNIDPAKPRQFFTFQLK